MTPLQIKIIELLCNDFRTKDIASNLNYSTSKIEKEIYWVKDYFQVKTINGLISKYYETNTTTKNPQNT